MFKKARLFFLSTRFRLTIWYAFVLLFLEILLGLFIYYYLFTNSEKKLDQALSTQANAILRIVKEKHVNLDSFEPDKNYSSEEDLMWDIIYDVVVFNERNTFIQISSGKKLLFKSANLGNITLQFPTSNSPESEFDFSNAKLSSDEIRAIQLVEDKYKVIVAYPKERIFGTLNSLTDLFLIVVPIFFVISLAGGYVISQRSLSRIDGIIKKTEEITAQNLNERIPGEEFSDEYGRLVKKMNEMIKRIKTSVDFMNQFSISAAHELKTPLTILRGEIELAVKSEKTPVEYIEILKSNYEETLRLTKIVDNLFFISKSENKLINVNKRSTDVKEFLGSLLKNLKVLADEKNVELILNAEDNLVVETDNELIKQAMINLVDNAVKYGSEQKPITIDAKRSGSMQWELSVKNNVDEMMQKNLGKIFDRFYRDDIARAKNAGGVGLGLSVVKSIAALHGGGVKVDNKNGELKVVLVLPV